MPNLFNSRTDKTSYILSNIKVIKIIAIILGLLIIIGLVILFWGLANSFSKQKNDKKTSSKIIKINQDFTNKFDFHEPADAQLISSSLGPDNQVLLRYLYKGKNTLIILDVNTKQVRSIITLKKGNDNFNFKK